MLLDLHQMQHDNQLGEGITQTSQQQNGRTFFKVAFFCKEANK